jgi:chemotaxis protein methyltransferase CheR
MVATTLRRETLSFLFAMLKKESGLILDDSKIYLVESRLEPIAKAEGFGSIDELTRRLQHDAAPSLRRRVIEAMTTNETSFFRDITPFTVLKSAVLPKLIKANEGAKRLRIWSGACSTGQEAYSIAFSVGDTSELSGWDVKILGTDIAEKVLERATAGVYTQHEVQRGLGVAYLVRFFTQQGTDWAIKPEIKRMVEFRQLNVLHDFARFGPFDVIFFRNILIYFDASTKKQILERIAGVLSPSGVLFLGGTETPLGITDRWVRVKLDQGVVYKRCDAPA